MKRSDVNSDSSSSLFGQTNLILLTYVCLWRQWLTTHQTLHRTTDPSPCPTLKFPRVHNLERNLAIASKALKQFREASRPAIKLSSCRQQSLAYEEVTKSAHAIDEIQNESPMSYLPTSPEQLDKTISKIRRCENPD